MTTSNRVFKGRTYGDHNLECPICHRFFKNEQGRKGHIRYVHERITDDSISGSAIREDGAESITDLKKDCERLELLAKRRKLTSELPSAAARPLDVMEQAGLGTLEGQAKELAQRRAMGVKDPGQAESWLSKLLATPGGVAAGISALRGVLDIPSKNDGGGLGVLKDLKDLGIDFKSLWERGQATKADSSFKVGPISLDGVSLTPEVLTSLITFQQAADSLNYQKAKDESFQSGMQQLLKLVQDSGVLSRIGGGIASAFEGRGPGRDISQRGSEPVRQVIICELCGVENAMPAPAEIFPGMIINCSGKDSLGDNCPRSWMVEDSRQAQKQQVKVEDPIVEEVPCKTCGQLLSLADKVVGDVIRCSICEKEFTIISPGEAIPASEPLSQDEKRNQAFMRKGEL